MSINSINTRRVLLALYVLGILVATWQRGIVSRDHTTFAIFRQSFVHLSQHQNLYAAYPAEQGAAAQDKFKYSPSAAMLFAPLAALPYPAALLLWNALSVGMLVYALRRLLPDRKFNLALLVLAPEILVATQASSSNALIAALIIMGTIAYHEGRLLRGGYTIIVGAAIKIFPLAAFIFAAAHRNKKRAAILAFAAFFAVLALPLLVISPAELAQEYRWWRELELSDANDLLFGLSLMRGMRSWWEYEFESWVVQAIGVVVFLLPLAARRDRWKSKTFHVSYLSSLLIFVTLFNHQAERQSFVIAATGAAIWLVSAELTAERMVLMVLAIIGVPVVPYLVIWLVIQAELLRGERKVTSPAARTFAREDEFISTPCIPSFATSALIGALLSWHFFLPRSIRSSLSSTPPSSSASSTTTRRTGSGTRSTITSRES